MSTFFETGNRLTRVDTRFRIPYHLGMGSRKARGVVGAFCCTQQAHAAGRGEGMAGSNGAWVHR